MNEEEKTVKKNIDNFSRKQFFEFQTELLNQFKCFRPHQLAARTGIDQNKIWRIVSGKSKNPSWVDIELLKQALVTLVGEGVVPRSKKNMQTKYQHESHTDWNMKYNAAMQEKSRELLTEYNREKQRESRLRRKLEDKKNESSTD